MCEGMEKYDKNTKIQSAFLEVMENTKHYKNTTPCQLRGGAAQPFCSEETVCIASSSTKWMRIHDRISLLNVGPWLSWNAKFGYIFRVS